MIIHINAPAGFYLEQPNSYRNAMPHDELPLKPIVDKPKKERHPAPAWVALAVPWLGLLTIILAIVVFIVPGSRDPVAEFRHQRPWSAADVVVTVAEYTSVLAVFVGLVVLWQMRTQPRPLSTPLAAQRIQAIVGLVLSFIGVAIIYVGILRSKAIAALAFALISIVVLCLIFAWRGSRGDS
jgi:hypothetical protein